MNWLTWALLSALFAGLTAILAKVGVKDIDSNLATAIRTVVILLFAWAIALTRDVGSLRAVTPRTWLFLVASGLATGASWLCYFRALQLGKAAQVAPIDKLSVVIAMLLAVAFLRERLAWYHWLGGALILGGVILVALPIEWEEPARPAQPVQQSTPGDPP
jgi:transporter family protein